MPTRDDYERLILHTMKEGDIVRVPCRDSNEYHAQRMTLFRLLKTMKSQGLDVNYISSRKSIVDDEIFLQIEHLSKDEPTFTFVKEDGTEEQVVVSRDLKTREDLEFELWQAEVKKLEDSKDS